MSLLIHSQPDYTVHCKDLLAELHSVFYRFITLLSHFNQTRLCVFEKSEFCLLTGQLLLKLLVFLHQKVERILQVLIAIYKHFVVLVKIIDKIFDEEQVICIERGQLYWSEISSRCLCLLLCLLNLHNLLLRIFLRSFSLAVRAFCGYAWSFI